MLKTKSVTTKNGVIARSCRQVELDDGAKTTLHIVCYEKRFWQPSIVTFDEPTLLAAWCEERGINEALVGGFFLTDTNKLLGEYWVDGERQNSVAIEGSWANNRGCLHIDHNNKVSLGPRYIHPAKPHNLMHAGPLLVQDGQKKVEEGCDDEGFRSSAGQFDSDISNGRYPRAAIGQSADHYWSVVCDGRSSEDAGLTLGELADVMMDLGANDALNLDGGASATQISSGELRNNPRGFWEPFPQGRPLMSAIVFNNSI